MILIVTLQVYYCLSHFVVLPHGRVFRTPTLRVPVQNSRAVWKSRWPSRAFHPNGPYGFCGRKATLNGASALVSNMSTEIRGDEVLGIGSQYVNRDPRTWSSTWSPSFSPVWEPRGIKGCRLCPFGQQTPQSCVSFCVCLLFLLLLFLVQKRSPPRIHYNGPKLAGPKWCFLSVVGWCFLCFLSSCQICTVLLVRFLSSWHCTVRTESLILLFNGLYSPGIKGANWLNVICHLGSTLVSIFSLWNIWYKSVVLNLMWLHGLVC